MPSIAAAKFVFRGDTWRKDGQYFGGHDYLSVVTNNTALAAGTNDLTIATVPTGEVWCVQTLTSLFFSSSINAIQVRHNRSGVFSIPIAQTTVVSLDAYSLNCNIWAEAGDTFIFRYVNATLNDSAFMGVYGIIFDLSE